MEKKKVSIVRYEKPLESVRAAVDLCNGLENLRPNSKVFIKPNIVFWTAKVPFPKWGVITTSRVVHDMVLLLKERGIDDITIGEGTVSRDPKNRATAEHKHETLGYNTLKKRYGVKVIDIFDRPFEKLDLGDGVELKFNTDILHSDFVVNLPVLKTHSQAVVTLGIKNLKGMIDVNSRKKCHSADPEKDLHFWVSKLSDKIPPGFTLLDGIYTNERGPSFDGKIRRSNLLVASSDIFAADKVGAKVLGFDTSEVPHLARYGTQRGLPLDLSDVDVLGENIQDVGMKLQYAFAYSEDGTLSLPMAKMGIKGLSYPKYDLTICTYCSGLTGVIMGAIAMAWKGEPWDNVEVLTGKLMKPTPGKKTILVGKCLYEANKAHSEIDKMWAIKTCPPSPEAIVNALHETGVKVDPQILMNAEMAPGFFMRKYVGKPEFDESFFRVE
jgi:uncharacterized protein (DUF362 family)